MAKSRSTITAESIVYRGWIIIDCEGGMKMYRSEQRIAPRERAIEFSIKVPRRIFAIPLLKAHVEVPADQVGTPLIIDAETVSAVESALKAGVGLNVTVTVGSEETKPDETPYHEIERSRG